MFYGIAKNGFYREKEIRQKKSVLLSILFISFIGSIAIRLFLDDSIDHLIALEVFNSILFFINFFVIFLLLEYRFMEKSTRVAIKRYLMRNDIDESTYGLSFSWSSLIYRILLSFFVNLILFPNNYMITVISIIPIILICVFFYDIFFHCEINNCRYSDKKFEEFIQNNYELNSIGLIVKKKDKKVNSKKKLESIELNNSWTKEGALENIDKTTQGLDVFSIPSDDLLKTKELIKTIDDITLFDVQLNKCLTSIVEILNVSFVVGTLTTKNNNIIQEFMEIIKQENINVVERVSDRTVGYLEDYAKKVKEDIS